MVLCRQLLGEGVPHMLSHFREASHPPQHIIPSRPGGFGTSLHGAVENMVVRSDIPGWRGGGVSQEALLPD
eukprot:1468802-Amphidinium_carterae.1